MSILVSPPLHVGDARILAIIDQDITAHRAGNILSISGRKSLLAILVVWSDRVTAFHPDGRDMSPNDLRALCLEAQDVTDAVAAFGFAF